MRLDQLKTFKQRGEKISCLTAYDASFAKVFEACGVDTILVGDSLGNVIQGGENTLGVSMEDMLYHTRAVANGLSETLLIADMPYQSYGDAPTALANAKRLIDAGADMVKFEGGAEHQAVFEILQDNQIPVCGHLGLQPQSILELGGYKVQGRDDESAKRILDDAKQLEAWGVEVLVLECVPAQLAKTISASISIPTIGIGAGADCDGQVLVSYDMLGIHTGYVPKFVKNFLTDNHSIEAAVSAFIHAVKDQTFPGDEHSY